MARDWGRPTDFLEVGRLPRPGLRSWIAPPEDVFIGQPYETWASVHDDGSIAVAMAIGGHRIGDNEYASGNECRAETLETFAADCMALLKVAAELRGATEYDLMIGVEWAGENQLVFTQVANDFRTTSYTGLPLAGFSPITTTVRPDADDKDYLSQVRGLATDLVNQAGLQRTRLLEDIEPWPPRR